MSQAYTADTPFRLAVSWLLSFFSKMFCSFAFFFGKEGFPFPPQVMGDSWVTDVKRSRSGHVVRSPMGEALCHSVTQTLGAVDPWF